MCSTIEWRARSAVARDGASQSVTDHWPAPTIITTPVMKEEWYYRGNSSLTGKIPASLCDENGFALAVVSRLVSS